MPGRRFVFRLSKTRSEPSSLFGRRVLHSENYIGGKFANWQVFFFARAKAAEYCEAGRGRTRPSDAPSEPVQSGHARPHHRGSAGEASTMGFEGASLRIVAKDAGVPHQLVIYYFKTKEEL
jgi:hypothetical protein